MNYKVETISGKFWSGNIATKKLEPLLNKYDSEGYDVKTITPIIRQSFFLGIRMTLIITFQKK